MNRRKMISKKWVLGVMSLAMSVTCFPVSAIASTEDMSNKVQINTIQGSENIKEIELVEDPQTLVYKVGDPFKASEISFKVYYNDGTSEIVTHEALTFKANGQTIKNGYKWQKASAKKMVVSYKDYETEFNVDVVKNTNSSVSIKDVELVEDPKTVVYKVGDPFKASEISFKVYYSDGTSKIVTHEALTFKVNNQIIKNGYKWKEASKKKVVVSYKDYETEFNVDVVKNTNSSVSIKEVELVEDPKTVEYKVGDPFKATEISFKVYYSDGTSKIVTHEALTFKANGQPVTNGYKWKQAGSKNVVVTYKDYSTDFKVKVLPNTTKTVKNCELLTEPSTLNYTVGDAYRADEISIRCYYTDGTYEDFDHYNLSIYAGDGAVQLIYGYRFLEAGKKNIEIKFLDYSTTYSINVGKGMGKNAWVKNSTGKKQYYQNGKALTGWQLLDDTGYFFNADGTMHTGWKQEGDKKYYFDKEGVMLAEGWVEDNNAWYYLNSDGTMATNTVIDGYTILPNGQRKE